MTFYLFSIISFLAMILIIITVHECGHYIAARCFNVKIHRFSIGFGKPLWTYRNKRGTEFVIAAIPIGGYVRMLDEREGPVLEEELPYSFNRKPVWMRLIVIFAGPLTNCLFAILVYWIIFSVGLTLPLTKIGRVIPHSIAATAGLESNMVINKIDQDPIYHWQDVLFSFFPYYGTKAKLNVTAQRPKDSKEKNYQLNLESWRINPLRPQLLQSLGIIPWQPRIPPIINKITENSSAYHAGLIKGDKILKINGAAINSWQAWTHEIKKHPKKSLIVTIKRHQKILSISLTPKAKKDWLGRVYGYAGTTPIEVVWPKAMLATQQYPVWFAIFPAIRKTWHLIYFNSVIIAKLITTKLSLQILAGPISLFKGVEYATTLGFIAFLQLLAIVSVSIGVINLLPIPGLDGGQALLAIIEAIRGKQISLAMQVLLYRFGLIFIFILIAQAIANDLVRI